MDETRLDSDIIEAPSGGIDGKAMRQRLAHRMFGDDAGEVRIGRFEILEAIGAGGMGVVYLARDPKLGRRVALKLLHSDAVGNDIERLRLQREAQALARLSHPNVVQLYEVGEHADSVFLAMEYVEGVSLRAWRAAAPRTWKEIVALYLQASEGLAAAHAAGLVHRDFKPANVLVGDDGRVRVADFGLAYGPDLPLPSGVSDVGGPASDVSAADSVITRPGAVLGTPAYMSPEQLRGEPVDARGDQFCFCVALWEALYGTRPYASKRLPDGASPAPRNGVRNGPARLRRALRRGLAFDPARRYPGQADLSRAIEAATRSRSTRWVAASTGAAAVGLAIVWPRPSTTLPCPSPAAVAADVLPTTVVDDVRARVFEVGAGFAPTMWPVIEQRLRSYAAALGAAQYQSCTIARDGTADPERATERCLQRRRAQLLTVTEVLGGGDVEVIARAIDLLDGLERPATCLDPEAPTAGAIGLAPEHDDLLRATDRIMVIARAGQLQRAADESAALVERARATGSEPVLTAALLAEGFSLREIGRVAQARDVLFEAFRRALALGDAARQAQAAIELTDLVTTDLEKFDEADEWGQLAEDAIADAGDPLPLAVRLLNLRGYIARLRGDAKASIALHEQALHRLGDAAAHPLRLELNTLTALANAHADAHRVERARIIYQDALQLAENELGPEHPTVGKIEFNLGLLLMYDLADPQAAIPVLERSRALLVATYGLDSIRIAPVSAALGNAFHLVGREDEALVLGKLAWELQKQLPENHSERAGALALIANVHLSRRDWDEARAAHVELAREYADAGDTRQSLNVKTNLGWMLCDADRPDDAAPLFEDVLAHADVAPDIGIFAQAGRARVKRERGDLDGAVAEYRAVIAKAEEIEEARGGAAAKWQLALLLDEMRSDPAEIVALTESALVVFVEHGDQVEDHEAMRALVQRARERMGERRRP